MKTLRRQGSRAAVRAQCKQVRVLQPPVPSAAAGADVARLEGAAVVDLGLTRAVPATGQGRAVVGIALARPVAHSSEASATVHHMNTSNPTELAAHTTDHGYYTPEAGTYFTARHDHAGKTGVYQMVSDLHVYNGSVATVRARKITMGRRHGVTFGGERTYIIDPASVVKLTKEMLADRIADCNRKHRAFCDKHPEYRYFETTTDPDKL